MDLKLPNSLRTLLLLFVLAIGSTKAEAQYVLGPEGFEGTFPPSGWALNGGSGTYLSCTLNWIQGTAGSVICPTSSYTGYPSVVANSGTHAAVFDAWWINSGGVANLVSPSLNMSSVGGFYQLSFWVYNDCAYCATDEIDVYVNTAPTNGGYQLAKLWPNDYNSTTVNNYSTGGSGYVKVTCNIPTAWATSSSYIIFHGYSQYDYDLFIDDVSVAYIAPCSGQPMAPNIVTAPLTAPLCSGGTTSISAFDPNTAGSLYNFWQQSNTGLPGSWTNIPNSSGLSYTTPALISTMYYRVADSCGISNQVNYSAAFTVPVNTYNIPYAEYFNTTLTTYLPFCFTNNVSGTGSKWYAISNGSFHDATGRGYPSLVVEDDVVGNSSGKNAFFTLPAIPLSAGATYRVRFGYERGRDNPTANTGLTYNENLQLFENYGVQPSTAAAGSPGGTNLFNTNVTTDGHNQASLTYTAGASGAYFFSWYSLTPHPSAGILVPGGYIAVDSIRIDSIGCNLPVITFQPQNAAVCLNNPVTLSVTATGYGLTYQWYKNGGAITGATNSTLTIASAQTSDAASYKVAVTGTCGGTTIVQSNTVSLTVSNYPTDTIRTTTPTTFCSGGSVVLTANAVGGNNYQWKVNGNFIPNAFGSTYTATTAGNYQSVVTNPTGCATTSTAVPVSVLTASAITVSPSGPTTFCNGNSVTLTTNVIPGVRYKWLKNGSPVVPADTTNVLTTAIAGTYTVQDSGANGCVVQFPNPVNVVVNGPTTAPTLSATGPLSFCLGGSVTLSASGISGSGFTYQWYQNNSAILGATGTTYTASASGLYKVNVVQNACALSSVTDTIAVDAPPTTVTNNGTIICSGNTIVLTAPAGAGLHYQWKKNGTSIAAPAGTAQVLYDTVAGSFQVQVTDSPANCVAISSVTGVSVGAPPVSTILATGPTTFCPGGSVTIKANSTDTSLNYIWNVSPTGLPGTYVALPTTPGAPYTPNGHHDSVRTFNTSGYYTVTEANGPCVSTSSPIQVIVSPVPAPVITPSGSTSLCPGGSVTLNTQSGTSQTYQWTNANGTPVVNGLTQSLNVNTAGTFKVSVTNGTGCTGTSLPVTVTTNSFPPDSIFTFGSDTICAASTTSLIASTCPGCTYLWKLNGSPAPTVQGPNNLQTYTAGSAGSMTVTVTSAAGCVATTPTPTTITVLPIPSSNVFALTSTTFCQGGSVVLSAGSGSGLTYQWQGGPIVNSYPNISGATGSTYTDSVSGYFRVIISNGSCAVSSVVIPVTVNSAQPVNITPSGSTSLCAGASVLLTATSLPGASYQWKLNNNNIPNANNAFFTASNSGNYTVVVSDNNCNSTSPVQQVTVHALPVAVVTLDGSSSPVSRNPICAGTPASLVDANAVPGFSYVWSKNGGAAPNANTNANYLATDSGLYTVAVKDTNGCVGISQPYALGEVPIPHPTVNRPGGGSILSTGTFVTYRWYFNGNLIPNDTTNSITIYGPGNYKVEVTDANGCPGISDEVYVANVGVKNVANNINVNIYPNPATTIVHVDAPVKVNVSVSALDGKVILHEDNATQIDLSQLANGVYMITVYDQDNNTLKIDKLVKTSL